MIRKQPKTTEMVLTMQLFVTFKLFHLTPMRDKSGTDVKFKMSYLLIGCSEFGGELLPQLVQLLLENRLLLLQREALPLKLLLQLLWKPIRDTNLSEQVSNKTQRAFDKELQ